MNWELLLLFKLLLHSGELLLNHRSYLLCGFTSWFLTGLCLYIPNKVGKKEQNQLQGHNSQVLRLSLLLTQYLTTHHQGQKGQTIKGLTFAASDAKAYLMAVDSMLLNHCAQSEMMYKLSAAKMRRQISCCFHMSTKSLKSFESDLN